MIKTVFLGLLAILLFSACSNKTNLYSHKIEKKEMIYSLQQAKELDMQALVKSLEHYPIIFVGDHHNTKKTHKFFENLLKALDKQSYNLYLINEWFSPEHDELLLKYTNNELDGIRLKERRQWSKFTKYSWDLVEPLYEAVKNNGGMLYGMNLTKKQRQKISMKTFDKMTQEEREFYDALDLTVSAHQSLVSPFLKHCHKMPQKSSEPCEQRMYRVQVAWDTYMAQNIHSIANKVIKTPKDKLLVFVGAMHVEQNLGIPLRFARLNNLPFMTISNEQIMKNEPLEIINHQADIVYIYE